MQLFFGTQWKIFCHLWAMHLRAVSENSGMFGQFFFASRGQTFSRLVQVTAIVLNLFEIFFTLGYFAF